MEENRTVTDVELEITYKKIVEEDGNLSHYEAVDLAMEEILSNRPKFIPKSETDEDNFEWIDLTELAAKKYPHLGDDCE